MDFGPNGERATDGSVIYPNCSAITNGYDASNRLVTETLQQYGATYIKTYTWTGAVMTGESLWVKQ